MVLLLLYRIDTLLTIMQKAIDDFYKDDVRPVNKTLAYRELQKQLQDPINYNNGTYKQIVTPQTYKDPDLRKSYQ